MRGKTKVYKVLVGKPKGKKPLGRTRRRWEVGIRVDLRGIGWSVWLNTTGSGYGVVASCFECGDEPSISCAAELGSFITYVG
jgi:hypothetical protein